MIKIFSKGQIEKELSRLEDRSRKTILSGDAAVRAIVSSVMEKGDSAVSQFTKKFDGVNLSPKDFLVKPDEIKSAYRSVDKKYLSALQTAIKNISFYHEKQKPDEWFETLPEDVLIGMRSIPIERVGIYVPGGAAAYPSSVLMNAIPAKIAGVGEIIMVTPPSKIKGKAGVNPYILVAAAEVGVTKIYKIGGAQAIAALAFGTETIPRVDKIVGPGNIYVTLAKKMVYGVVGIDKLAGPSDVTILADEGSDPAFIAADLLAQAEHDPDARAILVTTSAKTAAEVKKQISAQMKRLKRASIISRSIEDGGAIFVAGGLDEAIGIVNRIAPEHLEILIASPQDILQKIKNAGAVFLGPYSPAVVGDYIAGPNHVLPTSGSARFSSPLGVYDFVKKQSVLGYTKSALEDVKDDLKILAEFEGLDAHAKAVDIRF